MKVTCNMQIGPSVPKMPLYTQTWPKPASSVSAPAFTQPDRFSRQSTVQQAVRFQGHWDRFKTFVFWKYREASPGVYIHGINPGLKLLSFMKLPANERIANGTLVPTVTMARELDIFSKPRITQRDISIPNTNEVSAMLYDLPKDKYLQKYLKSKAIRELKRRLPSRNASVNDEMAFLERLSNLTNAQFNHRRYSIARQERIHFLDDGLRYAEALRQYQEGSLDIECLKDPVYMHYLQHHKHKPYRLLGESMKRGVGLCCHEALLNKVTLDYLKHRDLTISYKDGLENEDLDSLFSNESAHAWNTVTFPSNRKYLLDSTNQIWLPMVKSDAITPITKDGLTYYYISWNRLLKVDNPNLNPQTNA